MKMYHALAPALVLAVVVAAPAEVLFEATFDSDSASAGNALTSTANTASSGPATGVASASNVTYANSHANGGLAASFDGTVGQIQFGSEFDLASGLASNKGYTLSFAAKFGAADLFSRVFAGWEPNGVLDMRYSSGQDRNYLNFQVFGRQPPLFYNEDVWNHVILTVNPNAGNTTDNFSYTLYLDGQEYRTNGAGEMTKYADGIGDGTWIPIIGTTRTQQMEMLIDDVRIQDVYLDATQAYTLYEQDMLISEPAVLLGDANNDGVVSADDFAAVQTNFGNTGADDGLLPGDANDDGVVSADDFAAIQTNFGNVLGAAAEAAPIPEPATMALLGLGTLALIRRRRNCA